MTGSLQRAGKRKGGIPVSRKKVKTRGILGILGKRAAGQVYDKRSLGLVPVQTFDRRRLFFSLLVKYEDLERYDVQLTSAGNAAPRRFRKIYSRKAFPYLSLRPDFKGAYKTFFLKIALIRDRDDHEVVVIDRQSGDRERIWDIMALGRGPARSAGAAPGDREIAELAKMPYDAARPVARRILETALSGSAQEADLVRLKVYAALRVNHRYLRGRLQKAKPDENARLARSVNAMLEPCFIGPHGFNRKLDSIGDQELHQALAPLFSFIESIGAVGFLNNGTLLGARRSGDMLPHDDDLDIAIHVNGDTEAQVAGEWQRVRNAFSQHYQVIDKGAFFAVDILGGVEIDIFPAWTRDGRAFVYPICAGEMAHGDLLPVSQLSLRGTPYPAPRDTDALLALNYGPKWRVPDPYYKFDPQVAKQFEHMKNLLLAPSSDQGART